MGRDLSNARAPQLGDLELPGFALLVVRLVQRLWFCTELRSHPGARWFEEQGLKGFEFALAQHYGVPTGYMDLSESFDVSCFFATCRVDSSGTWGPVTQGSGVIYLLPTERIPIRPEALQPIGLQVLPRPREQFGWLVVCGINDDFEDIPGLQMFEFAHDEAISRHFLAMFDSGRSLFPPDAMADVAKAIMASKCLPKSLVNRVAEDLILQVDGAAFGASEIVAEICGPLAFDLQDQITAFNSALLSRAGREWAARAPDFMRNVGFRLVRTRKPDGARPGG